MTRRAYYQQQPRCGNGRDPRWTRETILAITALFVEEEHRFPSARWLKRAWEMPSWEVIRQVYGSMAAYRAAYQAAYPLLPAPPRAKYECYVRGRYHARTQVAQYIPCLRCDRHWRSPDPRCCRICPACHQRDDADDGLWLAGMAVVDAGLDEADLMGEELPYGH